MYIWRFTFHKSWFGFFSNFCQLSVCFLRPKYFGEPELARSFAKVKRAENFAAKFVVWTFEVLGHIFYTFFCHFHSFSDELAQELCQLDGARIGWGEMVGETASNLKFRYRLLRSGKRQQIGDQFWSRLEVSWSQVLSLILGLTQQKLTEPMQILPLRLNLNCRFISPSDNWLAKNWSHCSGPK